MRCSRWQERKRSLVLLPVLLLVPACAPPDPATPKTNILLITIDTLRSDHCSFAGYPLPTTPGLDAFARRGASLQLAYAPTATTGPTHASIFTSLYPIAHGLLKNGQRLHPELQTLAESLHDAGYQTSAAVSSYVLDARFGYDQGFESYDDDFEAAASTWPITEWQGRRLEGGFDRPANLTTDAAIEWIDAKRDPQRPFFFFAHYFDPHAPYTPPEPFASRFAPNDPADELQATIARYDAEIAFTDQQVDRLLDHLRGAGLEERTLVVITADHGEGLMQHGHMHHGVQIYEESVRVPLLWALPGTIRSGRSAAEAVSLVDLAPTILDLVGLSGGGQLSGESIAGWLRDDRSLDPERPVYMQRRHYEPGMVGGIPVAGEKLGIRIGPWKYVEGQAENTRELFNLNDDPGERANLYDSERPTALELSARLAAWSREHARARPDQPELTEAERERLGALGYVE